MVKAIETTYAGCKFRSRLEARWAVFFDALGVEWEYEPEGFELPSGRYLPDFRLPLLHAWFEVKGAEPLTNGRDETFALELSDAASMKVFLAWGQMPSLIDYMGHAPERRRIDLYEPGGIGDIDMAFCCCPWCGRVGIQYEGRGARICGWRAHEASEEAALALIAPAGHWRADDKCYTADDPRIRKAYASARSARFEHGQSGAVA